MGKPKVLYICHNHPSVRPGGAEAYGLELYDGMRAHGEFEPILLAKGGPPLSMDGQRHPGAFVGLVNGDPNQYFLYTGGYPFDSLRGTITDKDFYTKHVHDFLRAFQPDVVHFQHTLFLGYDMIRQVRNTLPEVPIVYTLHEYMPICHREGQMIRTVNSEELCDRATPQRCHECYPDISRQTFFLRKRFIQSHFSLVDLFLAPSNFLRQRFIDWGIPEEKIRFEENGRQGLEPLPEVNEPRSRNRFGFFGQLSRYKGLPVLLKAMKLLTGETPRVRPPAIGTRANPPISTTAEVAPHLWIHGANLDLQPGTIQNEIRSLLESAKANVTWVGPYKRAELSGLMANIDWVVVPSIWWENSPLVIGEAFAHGKPVICSDIGGMAEKVTNRVNGLHFRVADPLHLSQVLREAANTPGLWDSLRKGIPPVYRMQDHVATMVGLYRQMLQRQDTTR